MCPTSEGAVVCLAFIYSILGCPSYWHCLIFGRHRPFLGVWPGVKILMLINIYLYLNVCVSQTKKNLPAIRIRMQIEDHIMYNIQCTEKRNCKRRLMFEKINQYIQVREDPQPLTKIFISLPLSKISTYHGSNYLTQISKDRITKLVELPN